MLYSSEHPFIFCQGKVPDFVPSLNFAFEKGEVKNISDGSQFSFGIEDRAENL